MHPNAQVIREFYTSFQRLDAEGMVACYHPEVVFSDPAFGTLKGREAMAMWRMLCGRATDLKVTFSDVEADAERGKAHWEARYSFSAAKRPVHNIIAAAFVFRDGKIIQHQDTFDLWRWAGMALGPTGKFLGWLPPIQARIRRTARDGLDKFMQAQHNV